MTDMLRFIGVNKDTTTAGPGRRLELFTKGCIRGVVNPCENCFNESTWTFEGKYIEKNVDEVVEMISRDAWNRQVTFCGGEPMLQAIGLTKVAKRLKEIDPTFHIVMYTAYKLDALMKYGLNFTWMPKHGDAMANHLTSYSNSETIHISKETKDLPFKEKEVCKIEFQILSPDQIKELMQYVDIIVDGDYKHNLRLPVGNLMDDGQFIGSSNQRVIFTQSSLNKGELHFLYADEYQKARKRTTHCKCCGHAIKRSPSDRNKKFCGQLCQERWEYRNRKNKAVGEI